MGERILCGVVNFSHAKSYAYRPFNEMMNAIVCPNVDEVVIVGDVPIGLHAFKKLECSSTYADDMLAVGREWLRLYAIENGFDKMLWQGVDCYWQSEDDFIHVASHDVPIVSALTSGRADETYAVARRFVDGDGRQVDVPVRQLEEGGLVDCGFPGADAIFIRDDVFKYPFAEGHIPWYERVERGMVNVNVEENWILRMQMEHGVKSYVDADVRVWHHHDLDDLARMWPDVTVPAGELRW